MEIPVVLWLLAASVAPIHLIHGVAKKRTPSPAVIWLLYVPGAVVAIIAILYLVTSTSDQVANEPPACPGDDGQYARMSWISKPAANAVTPAMVGYYVDGICNDTLRQRDCAGPLAQAVAIGQARNLAWIRDAKAVGFSYYACGANTPTPLTEILRQH